MSETSEQMAFLRGIEPIMSALGKSFAQAFANYTVDVLCLSRNRGLLRSGLTDEDVAGSRAKPETVPPGLEGAPDWVRESYLASLQPDAPRMGIEEAKHRVAGTRLIRALRSRGMTQAELARRVGMKPASLSRVLKNPQKSRTSTLLKIARALELDVSDILE